MIYDILKVIVLSAVEGITEFLPISSTGHLILVNQFVKLSPESFSNAFNVIIQLGAILSVVVLYFKKLNPWDNGKCEKRFPKNYSSLNKQSRFYFRLTHPDERTMQLWFRVIVGFIPAMVLGFLFDDLIDKYLFSPLVVAFALVFWGVIIILIEMKNKKDNKPKIDNINMLSYKNVFLIGLFQCLAMIPGTSRSAATIIGGIVLGLSRSAAAEFSFFLAIPTMLGATFLKIIKNFQGFTFGQWGLILLGSILSFAVAYLVIKKFISFVQKHDFIPFGIYRIVIGIIVFIYFGFFVK